MHTYIYRERERDSQLFRVLARFHGGFFFCGGRFRSVLLCRASACIVEVPQTLELPLSACVKNLAVRTAKAAEAAELTDLKAYTVALSALSTLNPKPL